MSKKKEKSEYLLKKQTHFLSKDSNGYFKKNELKKLSVEEILELFINETSYQETMNVVRRMTLVNSDL